MIKTALITGSSGFIGQNLSALLIKKGYKVIGIDNKKTLKRHVSFIKLNKGNYKFLQYDLSNKKNLSKLTKILAKIKINSVWHFAANSDISKGSENLDIEFNDTFMTTLNALALSENLNIKEFIFASSSAIFGRTNKKISEDYGPCLPESNYGSMKLASESIISSSQNKFNKIVIARFPNVVGPDNTHGLIYDMIKKSKISDSIPVLGNGKQKKPYIHVKYLIEYLYKLYKHKNQTKIKIVNIGPEDKGVTVEQIINMLSKSILFKNKKFTYQLNKEGGWKGDIPFYHYNVNRLLSIIGNNKIPSSLDAINLTIKEINTHYKLW